MNARGPSLNPEQRPPEAQVGAPNVHSKHSLCVNLRVRMHPTFKHVAAQCARDRGLGIVERLLLI